MNPVVFQALVAMDAYNRGLRQGVKTGVSRLGNAVVLENSDQLLGEARANTGFVATSYFWNRQQVISFRGTDPESFSEFTKDVTYGCPLGAGNNSADQAQQAIEFYKNVVGVN